MSATVDNRARALVPGGRTGQAHRRPPRAQLGRERALRLVQRHHVGLVLLAVMGVGAVVRMVHLDAVGFNSDETVYAGQAAALAGNPAYAGDFPVFRAHPMLVQTLLSPFFAQGEHDVLGRYVVAVLGVLTLPVVYRLGSELYSPRVGLLAAAIMAVMPYHVTVSRQVLLDGPMVLFSTLTLLLVVKFAKTGRLTWMLAAGAALGLTMLTKESSVVLVGAVYAFFALTPSVRRPVIGSLLGFTITLGLFALHPLSVALSGHASTTKAYLVWQLVRRPNHPFSFYASTVPRVVGPLVVAAAVLAVAVVWRSRKPAWREVLLLSWVLVPFAAFSLWPVKGFQYLLPCAPALAVLAAEGIVHAPWRVPTFVSRHLPGRGVPTALVPLVVSTVVLGSLLLATVPSVGASPSATGLAGTGGTPGGREAGHWVRAHTPDGSVFLTLGPSMANIIEYYGNRRALGLSVSPNPLHRNPSYEPVPNPDFALRNADLQYVVWDSWSAGRSAHFSRTLETLARRFHGHAVHREYAETAQGRVPVIVIYEVRS
jgi:Dolichyl-phosphate-mannose-protein mannosyltransferase